MLSRALITGEILYTNIVFFTSQINNSLCRHFFVELLPLCRCRQRPAAVQEPIGKVGRGESLPLLQTEEAGAQCGGRLLGRGERGESPGLTQHFEPKTLGAIFNNEKSNLAASFLTLITVLASSGKRALLKEDRRSEWAPPSEAGDSLD